MLGKSPKERAIEVIGRLPDTATTEEILRTLVVVQQVEHGLAEVAAGRLITQEEVEAQMNEWRSRW